MISLNNHKIGLRALEPSDLTFLLTCENDTANWKVSRTQIPFSKYLLEEYLQQAGQSIYQSGQLRLVITTAEGSPIGLLDFFEFDPQNKNVGVGILIQDPEQRGKGLGAAALELGLDYMFKSHDVHQVWANIGADNKVSQQLFEGLGFVRTGCKKDWLYVEGHYEDEYFYQLIK